MRLRISTILCLTLFALTHAAPSRKPEGDSAKKDDQAAPLIEQGQDPFAFYGQQDPNADAMLNDCCAPGPACANPCPPQAPPQNFAMNFAQPPPPMLPPPPPPVYTGGSCCPPGPTCANPCAPPAAPMPPMPPMPMPPMPMPPMPMAPMPMAPPMMGGPCCDPNVVQQCANPCAPQQPQQKPLTDEGEQQTYAPYPGEITFKLMQKWKDEYLEDNAAGTQILKGNVEKAIQVALEGDQPENDYMQGGYYGYPGYGGYGGQQAPRQVTVSNIYFREGYVPGNPSTLPITVAHVMVNGGSDDASKLQALVTPDGTLGDGLKVYKDSFSAY